MSKTQQKCLTERIIRCADNQAKCQSFHINWRGRLMNIIKASWLDIQKFSYIISKKTKTLHSPGHSEFPGYECLICFRWTTTIVRKIRKVVKWVTKSDQRYKLAAVSDISWLYVYQCSGTKLLCVYTPAMHLSLHNSSDTISSCWNLTLCCHFHKNPAGPAPK